MCGCGSVLGHMFGSLFATWHGAVLDEGGDDLLILLQIFLELIRSLNDSETPQACGLAHATQWTVLCLTVKC